MKIIIAGAGRIGGSVAKVLAAEGHDVTIVELDSQIISSLSGNIDANCILGSATDINVLTDAGCANADLFISATESDEVNLVSSLCAKKLGAKYIIARIRGIEYANKNDFLKDTFGLYVTINPEFECAKEISRILRFPGASRVLQFSHGSTEVAQYVVSASSVLVGKTLANLRDISPAKIIIGCIVRGNTVLIPNGDTVFQPGDCLYIIASQKDQRKFFTNIGAYKKPVKRVMILGGNTISVYLARILLDIGMDISIIEKNYERCSFLAENLPDVKIIHGDGMDGSVLDEENIRRTDAFVALSLDEGDNLITSLYARDNGVGKTVTVISHGHFIDVIKGAGLDSIVIPKKVICDQILGYVNAIDNSYGNSMEALHTIADGHVDVLEFILPDGFNPEGKPVRQLHVNRNVLICACTRNGKSFIVDGDTVLMEKDHIIVMTPSGSVATLEDIRSHD